MQELDSLDDLGLLNRVCVFVPPVDVEEVRSRLEVLGRPGSFYSAWGTRSDDERSRIVALTSFGGGRTVMVAKKRTAVAYRAVAEELATRAPKDRS